VFDAGSFLFYDFLVGMRKLVPGFHNDEARDILDSELGLFLVFASRDRLNFGFGQK